jgi:hypothetical protein
MTARLPRSISSTIVCNVLADHGTRRDELFLPVMPCALPRALTEIKARLHCLRE